MLINVVSSFSTHCNIYLEKPMHVCQCFLTWTVINCSNIYVFLDKFCSVNILRQVLQWLSKENSCDVSTWVNMSVLSRTWVNMSVRLLLRIIQHMQVGSKTGIFSLPLPPKCFSILEKSLKFMFNKLFLPLIEVSSKHKLFRHSRLK